MIQIWQDMLGREKWLGMKQMLDSGVSCYELNSYAMIMIVISYVIIMIIMGRDNAMTGGGQNKSCQSPVSFPPNGHVQFW